MKILLEVCVASLDHPTYCNQLIIWCNFTVDFNFSAANVHICVIGRKIMRFWTHAWI